MEVKFWIVSCALVIVTTVLGFLLKMWFKEIIDKLDALVEELKILAQTKVVHEQQIKYLQEDQTNTKKRLNDHSKRIRNLELDKKK